MSTRIGKGRDAVEVGHGTNAVLLQLLGHRAAVVLTVSQAERLGVMLLRQATYARLALDEEQP